MGGRDSQSVAMHGSLLRAAIAACIVPTAYASCGPAEATKITDCQKALESPKSSGDQLKKDTCTYVKEMMECFPKDCCTDKKADVDRILADHRANLETTCDTDCGPHDEHDHGSEASTGSRLPASLAPLAAVAVALAASSRSWS